VAVVVARATGTELLVRELLVKAETAAAQMVVHRILEVAVVALVEWVHLEIQQPVVRGMFRLLQAHH
jgi:hypothetical protein